MERRMVLILALALIAFVMVVSVLLYLTNPAPRDKWVMEEDELLALYSEPRVMKAIDLTGDGKDELVISTWIDFLVADRDGNILFKQEDAPDAVTMGDFNGDGVDDVALAYEGVVRTYTGAGELIWERTFPELGRLSRANSLDVDGDGRREMVLGTMDGTVLCLDDDGSPLWDYTFTAPYASDEAYIRGLDDVPLRDTTLVAAANYAGDIAILAPDGTPLIEDSFGEKLRRLRAYDLNGDGNAEIVLGGAKGTIWLVGFEDGVATLLWRAFAGGKVSEVRDAQIDDDLATREFLVGTKGGLIMAFDYRGNTLFTASLDSKVLEFASVDVDGDGRDEVVAGTDAGDLAVFLPQEADILVRAELDGPVSRLETADFAKGDAFLVGTDEGVYRFHIEHVFAPWWYNPLVAGFIASVIIAAAALVLSKVLKPAPKLVYTVEDVSLEGLRTRRKMLLEQLAELRRLKQEGEMPPEVYLEEVRGLREQLAAVEEKMLAMGASIQPQVMKCPNCGAPIELGADRCEYCGQVIV